MGRLRPGEQRAHATTAQLEATLTGMTDGIMMVDADWNLLEWNEHFPAFAGVPDGVLRPGLPMREIVRAQAGVSRPNRPNSCRSAVANWVSASSGPASQLSWTKEQPQSLGGAIELRRPSNALVELHDDVRPQQVGLDFDRTFGREDVARAVDMALEADSFLPHLVDLA